MLDEITDITSSNFLRFGFIELYTRARMCAIFSFFFILKLKLSISSFSVYLCVYFKCVKEFSIL